jgi:hypothetical protein
VTPQKRNVTDLALLVPCVPGTLNEAADSRECFARNAERAGRLSRKDTSHGMSPRAERALLPTSRGKGDECTLVPMTVLYVYEHSEASRPTD